MLSYYHHRVNHILHYLAFLDVLFIGQHYVVKLVQPS